MNQAIDITTSQRKTILALLEKHLPNTTAWVYGSRVKWTSRPQSDLDMVVFSGPEQHLKVSDLREAFEESNLPFRVDLFVWDEIPEQFRKEIEADHVVTVKKEERFKLDNWRETTLGNLLSFSNGKSSPRRSNEFPHPVYGSNGVIGYSEDTNAEPNTIVVGRVGSYCGSLHYSTRICWVTDNAIRANAIDANDSSFLYYLLQTLRLNNWRAGSGQPLLNQSILSSIPVWVPDPSEQSAIAHILGALDNKIELNRRMNETLEAMARALFKSWFVDFDPVRAKIALKHRKSITPPPQAHHSPLEGESASQGRQPAGEPVGGRQGKGPSPQASRWGEIKRLYSPQTLKRAKALRQSQSNAEGLLWYYLRKKQLDGHKFRRQQPIGCYIVDFVCMPKKLVIELDGGQHSTQKAYDEQRDQFLTERGYRVLRFWNSLVFENCYGVLESILDALQDDATKVSESPPSPSPNHSPLEGESERQGPQPSGEPVEGRQSKGASPKLIRSPVSTSPPGGSDWTVERAKAYLERMPEDIADLFPDRLVPSELGKIPEGWKVKRIEDVAERVAMGPFGSSIKVSTFVEEGIPVISGQHLNDTLLNDKEYRYITEEHAQKLAKANVQRGDVIFTHAGNIGQVACIPQTSQFERYVISQRQFYMRCDLAQISPLFVVYFFKTPEGRHQLLANTSSTGVPSISRPVTYLRSINLCIPPKVLLCQFNEIVGRLHLKSGWSTAENKSIAALRDGLLPKLLSGEVRVKRAGKITWSVV